ncbi:MAG TPA: citrate/2-methylcitrate synthase [Candidatus Nitrosotenuis sp.]|nr:citrate/2-methylcitrate synthase [Candidatus Nitrosotenuis sp.]
METKNIGLRDIEIADTKISDIDGDRGKLIYRGYDILDLTKNSTFEETAYLLLNDELPTKADFDEFIQRLIDARDMPKQMQSNMRNWRKNADPMVMLQAFVVALAGYYDDKGTTEEEINYQSAINLIAKIPTIVASWERVRTGKDIVDPDPRLSHAGNFLNMLVGEKPDQETERIFDICLMLHADHTFNASTFAAREVASTGAHMYSAVSAAIGALSGPLHGGANYEVMKMLLEIKTVDNAESWVKESLAKSEKIMGMGHAVYKTYDPRAQVLKELSKKLAKKTKQPWYDITEKVEEVTIREMKRRKGIDIYPNVDLYSASLYYMLKIPPDLNTPIFAISRIAGWASHVIEEKFARAAPKPVLYRPKANYVGKYCGPQGCEYKPFDLREQSH